MATSGCIGPCLARFACRRNGRFTRATPKPTRTRDGLGENSRQKRSFIARRTGRLYPWGEEAPSANKGNFDFQSWDPSPVGAHPGGASAFGVHDLVGNGWEWTRTEFAPFPGFTPMPFYAGYSANF